MSPSTARRHGNTPWRISSRRLPYSGFPNHVEAECSSFERGHVDDEAIADVLAEQAVEAKDSSLAAEATAKLKVQAKKSLDTERLAEVEKYLDTVFR